ncbi:hypothetical protein [Conexibacter sp. CPCC 206217]|uniref:hypothetical protein n=1 Tax=Conexibacter sp. CPCC 206217 TaxID=3064574 RepID=UPI00271B4296|nr:hypothetical protein [Conexibacter sp. CPCC 206217]MDO8213007.1 hypothetical protein [Conexibacter sp. CPCC 206217]
MKMLLRGLFATAMLVASIALMGGSASASITPDPYSFGASDGGAFTSRTILGTSTCRVSGLTGTLRGTTTGAEGSVTAATISGCSGAIVNGRILPPIVIRIINGTVLIAVNVLIRNILGGECLYSGLLTGTIIRGASSITATNPALPLLIELVRTCTRTADVTLTINTGARISWL